MCVEISHRNSDNVIFVSDQFRLECYNKNQEQYFSEFGSQHHNTRAEIAIQNSMYMARTFMVHSYFHWTDHGADETPLWSFSIKQAVWLHNFLPNYCYGITPLELLTSNKTDHRNLIRSQVCRCPIYVLDPKLQNHQRVTKWNRRSCLGQLINFSEQNFLLIAICPRIL